MQCSRSTTGCNLETVITAIMLWLDLTHLASFGNATLWSIYLFLGNHSKVYSCEAKFIFCTSSGVYSQGRFYQLLSSALGLTISQLSNKIQDFYMNTYSMSASTAVLTHCKCELMQAIWFYLLDSNFLHAYEHGIIIRCLDGISCQVFLQLFTYICCRLSREVSLVSCYHSYLTNSSCSDRILLGCMKFLGWCPCPHCLISKEKIYKLGTKVDWWVCGKMAQVDESINSQLNMYARWFLSMDVALSAKWLRAWLEASHMSQHVYVFLHWWIFTTLLIHVLSRMLFLRNSESLASISILCLCLTSCTNLNSLPGKQQPHISFEFYLRQVKYRNSMLGIIRVSGPDRWLTVMKFLVGTHI